MPQIKNYGILAAIDWNSNKWQNLPTPEDLSHSNFKYVNEKGKTNTSLNFGHEKYACDEKDYYWGLLPQMWNRLPGRENSRYVEVVFIKAKNWKDGQLYIVGLYAFPIFQKGKKPSPIAEFPFDFVVNVKALPKDIYLLENFINFNTHPDSKKFLPQGKELGKQGYNYLTKENVLSILDAITKSNPTDTKFRDIKFRILKELSK